MISLDDMAELVRALLNSKMQVEEAEANLKILKENLRVLSEETIPSAMQELGLQSLVLETGQKIKISQDVYAAIPENGKPAAYNWLADNGFGGLIKTEVAVEFGKSERDKAVKFCARLLDQNMLPLMYESVHHSTLKAFLKEQIANGSNIPLELFGARPVWKAEIK